MTDNCIIGRDIEGVLDDVIDEVTGEITPPPDDETVIYTGGCLIIPAGIGQNEGAQGQPVELPGLRTYRGFIPREVLDIEVHDTLLITTSLRDPDLVGRKFTVRGIKASTFAIFRELTLEGFK
jgi:hypothetical protein